MSISSPKPKAIPHDLSPASVPAQSHTITRLKAILAGQTGIEIGQFDPDASLAELGIDSLFSTPLFKENGNHVGDKIEASSVASEDEIMTTVRATIAKKIDTPIEELDDTTYLLDVGVDRVRSFAITKQLSVNHANAHRGWFLGGGPYFCGTDADGNGPEFLAAVLNPQCGATIWVKNTGTFGPSVDNGIGSCIEAKLVDQEGGGSVDLNPAAWSALTNSPDGQVTVEWGYGSCSGGTASPPPSDPRPAATEAPAPSEPPFSAPMQGCTVQANEQCGGQDFTG
ncbi:MAG: hypothetical protein Q9191_005819, partial [Dirinaria sp. TL-2023a]